MRYLARRLTPDRYAPGFWSGTLRECRAAQPESFGGWWVVFAWAGEVESARDRAEWASLDSGGDA